MGGRRAKTFSEYVVSSDALLAKIPDKLSFEQAATINLGAAISFIALYRELKLPRPQEHKVFDNPEYILVRNTF
ncbi:hypothetical protein BC936DRAFT_141625 [Jimgerdemannia flammicorona]|uniref:Uncharacterized protein n=1 Tax=Jimgerdemannia flammicorona TaxID=994334 RepID=A0A433DFZ2_9FUNG|nr:hypothetical protein BC936DRAFT_141625 [Jimgerdemannia flammicorona]